MMMRDGYDLRRSTTTTGWQWALSGRSGAMRNGVLRSRGTVSAAPRRGGLGLSPVSDPPRQLSPLVLKRGRGNDR